MAVFEDAYTLWTERRLTQAEAAPVDEVMRMVDRYRTRHAGWNVRHYYSFCRR